MKAKRNLRHSRFSRPALLLAVGFLIYLGIFFSAFRYNSLLPNIESAWQYGLASFRHHPEQSYGNNVYYTYGPLVTHIVTTVHSLDTVSHDFVLSIALVTLLLGLCLYGLFRALGSYAAPRNLLFVGMFAVALVCTMTVDILFFATLLAMYGYLTKEPDYRRRLLAVLGLIMLATYKNSFLIALLPILVIVGLSYPARQWYKRAGLAVGLVLVQLFALVLGGVSVANLPRFLSYAVQNARAYGQFMSLDLHPQFVPVFLGLFAVFAAVKLSQAVYKRSSEPLVSHLFILSGELWILFVVLKNAIVRSDVHLILFLPFVFYLVAGTVLSLRAVTRLAPRRFGAVFIVLLAAAVVSAGVVNERVDMIPSQLTKQTIGAQLTLRDVFDYYNYANFSHKRSASQATLSLVTGQTRLLRTNFAAYLAARHQNVDNQYVVGYNNDIFYLPALAPAHYLYGSALQNFAAYPPRTFDSLYLQYLKDHPDYYVFWDNVASSIDYRLPAEDLPDTIRYLQTHYQTVVSDAGAGLYILGKRPAASQPKPLACHDYTSDSRLGSAVSLLPNASRVRVVMNFSPVYKLRDIVYKDPVYTIQLIKRQSLEGVFRVTPDSLARGMYVNPLLPLIAGNPAPFNIDRFVITANDNSRTGFSVTQTVCR